MESKSHQRTLTGFTRSVSATANSDGWPPATWFNLMKMLLSSSHCHNRDDSPECVKNRFICLNIAVISFKRNEAKVGSLTWSKCTGSCFRGDATKHLEIVNASKWCVIRLPHVFYFTCVFQPKMWCLIWRRSFALTTFSGVKSPSHSSHMRRHSELQSQLGVCSNKY